MGGWGGLGGGKGVGVGWGGVGKFPGKFPGEFWNFPGIFRLIIIMTVITLSYIKYNR